MSKIKILTSEQFARLEEIRTKWFCIALSTEPADRLLAEDGVNQAYAAAGLSPPAVYLWLRSPREGLLAAALCEVWRPATVLFRIQSVSKIRNQVWGSVRQILGDLAWNSVANQLREKVEDQAYHEVWRLLDERVWATGWSELGDYIANEIGREVVGRLKDVFWTVRPIEAGVFEDVWRQVSTQLVSQIGVPLGAQLSSRVWDRIISQAWRVLYYHECLGQHSAGPLSLYDYFHSVVGVAAGDQLAGLMQVCKSCGWWWPYRKVAILTERPCRIFRDSRGHLHNENAPAIEYPDGWRIYALHGVSVPKKYVETSAELIDPRKVLRERNAAVRAAVISKIGFHRMLSTLSYRVISKTNCGSLVEFDFGDVTVRGLHLVWSDKEGRKETVLPVPRTREDFGKDCPENIDDCEQVRRWTLGWSPDVDIAAET